MSLRARLISILCACAAIATALSLAFQDRTLASDLEAAAAARLERSASAADVLIDAHLESLAERYRAIAGTPQLRANLELEDPPTLAHYAEELRRRFGASRLTFVDARGRALAAAGDEGLDGMLLHDERPRLLLSAGQLYAATSVEIGRDDERVGRLFAAEPISDETLATWGELCGASVVVAGREQRESEPGSLWRPVRGTGQGLLRVESDFGAERAALLRSRLLLLASGLIALVGALCASLLLSRGLVASMRDLLVAAERIGRGDFGVRLAIGRSDEVGDVARAVNEMAEGLETSAMALEAQHADLRVAVERAEAASQAKTNFLANVSHEIRTPMTAVLGFVEMLATDSGEPEERAAWAASVRRNGAQLLELIDRILDVSRSDSESLRIERRAFDLRALIESAASPARERAREKGLAFACEIEPSCPESLESDPARVREILAELLSNALKFCPSGRVELRVARSPRSGSKLSFAVSDTGVGIPARDQERIFAPFGQVDESHSRSFGGAGVGLAFARRLAGLLGGSLRVESEPGRGSTFTLELEATPRGAIDPAAPVPAPTARARVLLAEDGPDNQRLIRALLAKRADVALVENGAQALATAMAALDSGEPPDLVLMDMQMPVMDGYEATRRLRESGYDGPIVALTAHAMSGDRERCLAAGCDEYLTKPIDRARLLDCLERFARERKPEPQERG